MRFTGSAVLRAQKTPLEHNIPADGELFEEMKR